MSLKVKKNRIPQVKAKVKVWDGKAITIGVHSDAGAHDGGKVPISLGELAAIHEFGLGPPARPFISQWAELKLAEGIETFNDVWARVVVSDLDPATAFRRIGEWCVGSCKQHMANGILPPNAPATVARKGSSTPLIDTGQLRNSIAWKYA